jgi:anti-sigma factor RsiW
MRRRLDAAVRAHVAAQRLTDAQWARLEALQQAGGGAPREARARRRPGWPLLAGVAAAFAAVGLALGLQLATLAPLPERIAGEVARNHAKHEPLEVRSGNLEALEAHFAKLDFVPVAPARLEAEGWTLLGGLYCSLRGRPAAQLRVQHPITGDAQTLYQARYDPEAFPGLPRLEAGDPPLTVVADGLPVRLWVEQGILFALTGG